jgi:hypothetical protein
MVLVSEARRGGARVVVGLLGSPDIMFKGIDALVQGAIK